MVEAAMAELFGKDSHREEAKLDGSNPRYWYRGSPFVPVFVY